MKLYLSLIVVAVLLIVGGISSAQSVPRYLSYQSALYDEGGTLISDGPASISVRVYDAGMNAVFEETHDAEIVRGIASLMVGSGTSTVDGKPSGGIAPALFIPEGPLYLEVQVEGYSPEPMMEIASVPYAMSADVANSVADSSVGSASIKDASIEMRHFTDEVLDSLTEKIIGSADNRTVVTKSDFDSFKSSITQNTGAAEVGVSTNFAYSASEDVQGVLRDLDLAIKKREEEDSKIKGTAADISSTLTTHKAASNPHGITPATIGAASAENFNTLNTSFVTHTGAVNPHNITPAGIGAAATGDLANYYTKTESDSIFAKTLDVVLPPPPPPSGSLASAWVSASGSCSSGTCDLTMHKEYNVGSVQGVGGLAIVRINFETPMPDENYAVVAMPKGVFHPDLGWPQTLYSMGVWNKTAEYVDLMIYDSGGIRIIPGDIKFDLVVFGG